MDYDFTPPPALIAHAEPMRAGAFQLIPVEGAEAKAALATALKLVRTVGELETTDLSNPLLGQVERQIVAGRNYRVSFTVGPKNERHAMKVAWYEDLKGKRKVTQVYFDGSPIMGT